MTNLINPYRFITVPRAGYTASTRYALDRLKRSGGTIAQSQYGFGGLHDASRNKTWIAWANNPGGASVRVLEYDHAAAAWAGPFTVGRDPLLDDDHTVPVLEQLADGRLVVFWGSHNDTAQPDQLWAISDAAGDASAWTVQTPLDDDEYVYPKPVDIPGAGGAGDLVLLHRRGPDPKWDLGVRVASYTSGGAVAFGAASLLVELGAASRVYADKCERDGAGGVEIVWTQTDDDDVNRRGIYYGLYDPSAGSLSNLAGTVTTASGSLPIDAATADADYRLVDVGTDRNSVPTWCRDAAGDLHIVYARGTGAGSYDVMHQVWPSGGGSPTSAVVVAEAYEADAGNGRIRSAQIIRRGMGVRVLWSDPSAWGDLKYRDRYGGSWGAAQTLAQAAVETTWSEAAPIRRAHPNARVILAEEPRPTDADYDDPQFLPISVYGDTGFLTVPSPTDADYKYVVAQIDFTGADGSTSATDESQTGAAISFSGCDIQGNALSLDATDDYCQIVSDAQPSDNLDRRRFDFDGEFCWEIFELAITGDTGNGANGRCWIFGNANDSNQRGSSIHYDITAGEWRLQWAPDITTQDQYGFAASESPVGKTVYLAVTRDASDDVRVFMSVAGGNLVQQGSAVSLADTNVGSHADASDFVIGARQIQPPRDDPQAAPNTRYCMAGTIGAVRISNGTDRGLAAGQAPPTRAGIWDGRF